MAQKEIELILLRQCASHLSMPIWIVGPDSELLYYNEPAEDILGRRFHEAGPMPGDELAKMFTTTDEDGLPFNADDLPINIALTKRKPAYLPMRIRGLDGEIRMIEVTAFPITGHKEKNLGAMAIFWETEDK